MKLRSLILTFALALPFQQAHADILCRSILFTPDNLTLSTFHREPEDIGDSLKNSEAVNTIAPHIQEFAPFSQARAQCYGTCYAYSNALLIENFLRRQAVIPKDSLLLTSPILATTALRRIKEKPGLSIEKAIEGGTSDVLHDASNSSIFYIQSEHLSRLGGIQRVLSLEADFFRGLNDGSFRYRGLGLREILKQNAIFSHQRNIVLAFQEYLKQETGAYAKVERAEIGDINYFNIDSYLLEEKSYLVSSHVSTALSSSPKNVHIQITNFLQLQRDLPNSPFSFASKDFMRKLMPSLIKKLYNSDFARVTFDTNIFGGSHTVILTNLVINRANNTLLGFLFLNSYGPEWGFQGYGFITVEELARHATGYEVLTRLETKP